MLAEWTAACADDDPTLVVPWSDADSGLHFVDLRAEPYDIAEIHEAEQFPALGRALRALNAARSPLLTAKCDAWPIAESDDTLAALRLELDADAESTRAGFAGYIDLLWRDRALFASAHQQQERLDRVVRRAQRIEQPDARLELTLRPALYENNGLALEGYAVTLYVFALAAEDDAARRTWELALEDVVALLRSKDFELQKGSSTIDAA